MHVPLSILRPSPTPPVILLTTAADAGLPLLANDEVHAVLRDLWLQSAWTHGWFVGEYLLMPERVHLFARRGRSACPLEDWMPTWKASAAFRLQGLLQWDGAIWRTDYADRCLESPDAHAHACADLADSPVQAGLARTAADWRFSGLIWNLQFLPPNLKSP